MTQTPPTTSVGHPTHRLAASTSHLRLRRAPQPSSTSTTSHLHPLVTHPPSVVLPTQASPPPHNLHPPSSPPTSEALITAFPVNTGDSIATADPTHPHGHPQPPNPCPIASDPTIFHQIPSFLALIHHPQHLPSTSDWPPHLHHARSPPSAPMNRPPPLPLHLHGRSPSPMIPISPSPRATSARIPLLRQPHHLSFAAPHLRHRRGLPPVTRAIKQPPPTGNPHPSRSSIVSLLLCRALCHLHCAASYHHEDLIDLPPLV